MRKIDLFGASKTMSTRVEEYVKCRVLRKSIMKNFNDQIKAIEQSLKNLENLRGSIREDQIDFQKESFLEKKESLLEKRDEQLKKEATFEFTEADKAFKKALKGRSMDSPVIETEVIKWFSNYGLDVTDTQLLADVLSAIGGKEDFNRLVDTDGIDGITVDNNRALSMLYWTAFYHMANAGTIKPAQIPEIIQENFGQKAQEAKKAARKARKKASKKVAA